jgi:predicted outer membrane protein
MKTLQNLKGTKHSLIAAVVAATLIFVGCSTSRKQPSAENSTAAAATPAAQPTADAVKAKREAKRATASTEVSTKSTNAAILNQIHQADQKEIALGNMAAGKASTAEVQNYAKQLVEDHTGADQQVLAVAHKMNVRLRDSAVPRQGRSESAKLKSAAGPAFDREFLRQSSADHDKLIRELKQEREDASDDDIEALIDKILPILEQHQQLAQILLKKEQA